MQSPLVQKHSLAISNLFINHTNRVKCRRDKRVQSLTRYRWYQSKGSVLGTPSVDVQHDNGRGKLAVDEQEQEQAARSWKRGVAAACSAQTWQVQGSSFRTVIKRAK
uniref:Uncharacterized protein n=1 Tax=Utricularia reniformis TaxID=192314 RepID=A0A1Y0B0A3_9LAMI|nr:hypothetical protein AEK19_MT0574 [Utricularia reniformis]ART30830.1 hypothetical protein AEK19_MT0574 [Utricularia reniformis]